MSDKLRGVPIPQMAGKQEVIRQQMDELKVLASPLVEWIRENLGPCAEIRISYDSAQIWEEGTGVKFLYSEK